MYLIIICIVYTRFAKICDFLFDTKYLMLNVWGVCNGGISRMPNIYIVAYAIKQYFLPQIPYLWYPKMAKSSTSKTYLFHFKRIDLSE